MNTYALLQFLEIQVIIVSRPDFLSILSFHIVFQNIMEQVEQKRGNQKEYEVFLLFSYFNSFILGVKYVGVNFEIWA